MDNKDFDNIFSENLGEEQDFDFRESDWDEIAEKVQSRSASGFVWWKWLFPALLLIFGGTTYCLVSDLKETKEEVLTLRGKISNTETERSSQSIEKIDTHYQSITIIAYDTIYKQVLLEERISTRGNQTVVGDNIFTHSTNSFAQEPVSDSNQPSREISSEESDLSDLAILKNREKENSIVSNLTREINLEKMEHYEAINTLPELVFQPVEVKKKRVKQPFYLYNITTALKKIKAKNRLKIGLTNAWGITENKSTDYYSKNGNFKTIMLDLGLRAEWAFTKRIRVFSSIALDQIYLNTSDLEATFDSILQPDLSSHLMNAKIKQTALHYELGLKYLLNKGKKWTPYGGLSINAQSNLKYHFDATYIYAYQAPNTKKVTIKTPGFKWNSINYFWGFEYQFSKQFSWQIEQWYRLNLKKREEQMYSSFGIRNTILYHF